MRKWLYILIVCAGCHQAPVESPAQSAYSDTTVFQAYADSMHAVYGSDSSLPDRIVAFAKTQIGVPYRYCSMSPEGGFDCSGFVNYVFNHFGIKVPRSSVDFTNEGEEIELQKAKPGDVILFTGTDPHKRVVGHVGIITTNDNGDISFIQSTSGEAYGVVISPLDAHYRGRFVKVVRIVK